MKKDHRKGFYLLIVLDQKYVQQIFCVEFYEVMVFGKEHESYRSQICYQTSLKFLEKTL